MKLIRVTYRATFQQPLQGPMNPMGLRITAPLFVEVYQASKIDGSARTVSNGQQPNEAWPIQHGSSADQMLANVRPCFETQLTPWEYGATPARDGLTTPFADRRGGDRENGQLYFKEPAKENI